MCKENNSGYPPADIIYTEWFNRSQGNSFRITRILESIETPYQKINLYETEDEGKLLVHDDAVMLTERFEEHYHDMLVHPALVTHPNPQKVLVIGGGDGGTIREVLKHSTVQKAWQYEIDEEVINISRKHLKKLTVAYDNPRAEIIVGDGIDAVEKAEPGSYDVIIVDSTDPVGPAEILFTDQFYQAVFRALKDDGIMSTQVANYAYHLEHYINIINRLSNIFPLVRPYNSHIPMYPSGVWSFAFASKEYDPLEDQDRARALELEKDCHYWNREIHLAAFAFPNFVRKALNDV